MRTRKILWGLLIIGCGVMLLLAALGIGQEYDLVRIIGSVLLLGITIASLVKLRYFMSMLPLAVIIYLWREPLGLAEMDLLLLIASVVVLGIGLSVIFHRRSHIRVKVKNGARHITGETLNEEEAVQIEASFSEQTKYVHATNLKQVNIASNFASVKVYFDQCQVSSEGLSIQASGNFSGIELYVPRNWIMENQVNTFAASVTEKNTQPVFEQPVRVALGGNLNFAEIKIVHT